MLIFILKIKVFLIKEAEGVGILIKEEEVSKVISIIIMASTTTMEDLEILAIILIQGSILSYKDLQTNLNPIGHLVKSMERVVIQPLIVIIEWTLHIKGGMHLLSWLQWWLTHLKCNIAMAGLLIQAAQIMSLLIYLNCLSIDNLLQVMKLS